MKLPKGCYVAEMVIRQAEPDCCEDAAVSPLLRFQFLDGGGGHYPRLVEVKSFATEGDGNDLAVIEKVLREVAAANDVALEAFYSNSKEDGK